MWFDPGYGYHVDDTTGVATGNEPQSIYAVMSGTHVNGVCCFDYGNSETNDKDDGCGTMEAIYFGNAHWHGNTGAGTAGPWVGADLEQGMYYGTVVTPFVLPCAPVATSHGPGVRCASARRGVERLLVRDMNGLCAPRPPAANRRGALAPASGRGGALACIMGLRGRVVFRKFVIHGFNSRALSSNFRARRRERDEEQPAEPAAPARVCDRLPARPHRRVRAQGTPREPFNSTPMVVNSIPSGSPHVRPMSHVGPLYVW